MLRRLSRCIREYKKPTVITVAAILLEVVLDVLLPFTTARLVNRIQAGIEMGEIIRLGAVLVAMAIASLACGGIAGFTSSRASSGFAKNLRHDIYEKVQTFDFANIDHFSSSSLVTRLTTDVGNVQMAFMMLTRIAIRAPLMLIFSIVMAYIMGGALATSFVVLIPLLGGGLMWIGKKALPAFRSVFKKYDRLNESVEENVRAMRGV